MSKLTWTFILGCKDSILLDCPLIIFNATKTNKWNVTKNKLLFHFNNKNLPSADTGFPGKAKTSLLFSFTLEGIVAKVVGFLIKYD